MLYCFPEAMTYDPGVKMAYSGKCGIPWPADFTVTVKGDIITRAMLEGNILHVATDK